MKKIGIVGATGYTGAELIRILLNHPKVKITSLSAKIDKPAPIAQIFPQFKGVADIECEVFKNPEKIASKVDIVFLAVPHTVALNLVPPFLKKGVKVIDLSADYRFDEAQTYERWYGLKHGHEEFLKEKVYGLPEFHKDKIKKASLIANPGCYPTSVILGAAPLAKIGIIDEVIANSMSGVSGAGRTADISLIFPEIEGNLKAYKIGCHRHQPEMEEKLSKAGPIKVKVTFIPHLAPISRGILTTMYLKFNTPADKNKITEAYKHAYKNEPFVKLLEEGETPQIKMVRGTNDCHISVTVQNNSAVVVTAIDNLIKGASGQAVQNMNLMCGWEETKGLVNIPLCP